MSDYSKSHDWRLLCEETFAGLNDCQHEATEIINFLDKKVERLEKAIWEYEHEEHSNSPKAIQEYLESIYTGEHDERFDKIIEQCKKDWE